MNDKFTFLKDLFVALLVCFVSGLSVHAQETRTVTINSDGASENGFSVSPAVSAYDYSNDAIDAAKMCFYAKGDYVITIPSDVTVSAVSFYACVDNNASDKGGLTSFNGTECTYTFVNRKSTTFTTVDFTDLSVTSSLPFTLDCNSGMAITLTVSGENTSSEGDSSEGGSTDDDGSTEDGDSTDEGDSNEEGESSDGGLDDTTGSTFDPNDPSEGTPDPGTVITNGLVLMGQGGWFEAAYIEWKVIADAKNYNVYIKAEGGEYARINKNLVRNYGTYGRADMVGLKAGTYKMKVVAVDADGAEMSWGVESDVITVKAHDRGGFAHKDGVAVGAYNNDGTLKANTQVLYVTDDNFDTVEGVIEQDKGPVTFVGVGNILKAIEKGYHTDPLCIRIVGAITSSSQLYGDADALQLKGNSNTVATPVTIEGIGRDATLKTFGIIINRSNNIEVRNIGFNGFADDGISIKESVKIWIHNNDIFYGATGSASDQAKGDGSLDVKDNSQYCTFSYNHFLDAGKSSLCGMKKESGENFLCYHHNWFNHSDSRHPRVRTMTVHVYNNYYDGVSKYGVGATTGANVFVENNYFRNTNRPMMSSLQGTDATGKGTFSSENGGMIKAYGNVMVETGSNYSFIAANNVTDADASVTAVSATSFDAYYATSRDEKVPSDYVTLKGGTAYNNFDTDPSKMHTYTVDAAIDVPGIVMSWAGRMQGGDYHWVFDNATDDYDYDVNTQIKSELGSYESTMEEVGAFTTVIADATLGQDVVFYADADGNSEFATVKCNGYVMYPLGAPTMEGMTFVGWNIAQGTAISENASVYPMFSDGKSSITPPAAQPETSVVKSWVFDAWSTQTQTAVAGNSELWTKDASTDRYDATFAARSSLGVEETEGLEFLNKVRISFDDSKGLYLQGSFTMYVPVEAGERVSVVFSNTGSSNGSRDLLINGEVVASSESTSHQTATYEVPEGMTEIEVKGSAGLNYFFVTREKVSTSIADVEAIGEVVNVEVFDISGKKLQRMQSGLNIVRTTYDNGVVVTEKILVK